ncbi:MAG: hypothetical protein IT422_02120 [Pirellulaceae bacterium]|nr:hypothetical protein [Pirellulaceae bacterium]
MKLRDCVLLLASYELDGFPRTLPSQSARDLLSGWIAMWHPRLLAALEAAPRWQSAAQLPSELNDILFVLPALAVEKLEADAEQRIADAGGHLLRPNQTTWRDFQDQLLRIATSSGLLEVSRNESIGESIGEPASQSCAPLASPSTPALVEELRDDFAALGYAFLQIQLMTRQLRYTSNLDLLQFGQQLTSAAQAALADDRSEAERWLQACFDALGQERDHYYSLDAHLIDITLLAPTTLGKSLTAQLERTGQADSPPTAYLASGELLRELSGSYPQRLSELQSAVQQRQACLVGGLDIERPHALMQREQIARDYARGRTAYQTCGFEPPRVFARRSYGLTPDSVSMLRRWGFEGCLLIAWAGGSYPHGAQPKISWEAPDGTFLSALACDALDAADPASYLALGWKLGDALEHQHVPSVLFAHWPNRSCEFAELLARVCRRTPALGKWKLADDYFANTDQPYHQERLSAASFQHNWLLQTAPSQADDARTADTAKTIPFAAHWRTATQLNHQLQTRCRSLQNLLNLAWQLEQFHHLAEQRSSAVPAESVSPAESASSAELTLPPAHQPLEWSRWAPELAELVELVDSLLDAPQRAPDIAAQSTELADRLRDTLLERLARQLQPVGKKEIGEPSEYRGRLLVNPRSSPVRVATHTLPEQHLADSEAWHFADGRVGEGRVTCVDIPSHGFVVTPLHHEQRRPMSKERPLADAGGLLSNEFLEAQIDPARGHLRTLHIPAKRGNRLSVMIARRDQIPSDSKRPSAKAEAAPRLSEMVATNLQMLTSSNVCGVVRTEGNLQLDGDNVARFDIVYEVWRGSRIVEVNIRLHDLKPLPSDNPWQAAYVLRIAWPTEAAVVRTFSAGQRHVWSAGRGVSPTLIEIDEVDYRTHYLTGGLAFHRRSGERFLETVLASSGETEVSHRIGIAIDLPYPTLAAEQFLDTPYEIDLQRSQAIAATSGWMASVSARNVTVQLESPLVDSISGGLVGLRLFVSELEGKATSAAVRLLREVASATRVDYLGGKISQLTTNQDKVTIALRAHEQVNVDVLWKG